MKLSSLLAQRFSLLRQAHLANLAFGYTRLTEFARRIARAQLRGEVRLQHKGEEGEPYWAALTALEGSQSVIEEHFTDEDITDLADIIAYASGEFDLDLRFRLEDLAERFLSPVQSRLEQAGVIFDQKEALIDDSTSTDPSGQAQLGEKS